MIAEPAAGNGRLFILLGSIGGFLGVALGAFGAHALERSLSVGSLQTWETGVRYLFLHSIALLAVGVVVPLLGRRAAMAAGWLFILGIVIFSGSLFALALGAPRGFGAVTPFGGGAWLAGWAALAFAALRARPAR